MQKIRFLISVCLFVLFTEQNVFAQGEKKNKICTGSLLERYYSTGIKLCSYISGASDEIYCEVVPTKGFLENLWLLGRGKIDFPFTMSNLAIASYEGKCYFTTTKPFKIRYQTFRLHDKIFTMSFNDNDILVFSNLGGKKISNVYPKSDSSIVYESLKPYYDLKNRSADINFHYEDYVCKFCSANIDVIILITGYPSTLVNFITYACESDSIAIDNKKIYYLLKSNPGFNKIPFLREIYSVVNRKQNAIAVNAIMVITRHFDKKTAKNCLDYFLQVVDGFHSSHTVLYGINKEDFVKELVLSAI